VKAVQFLLQKQTKELAKELLTISNRLSKHYPHTHPHPQLQLQPQ